MLIMVKFYIMSWTEWNSIHPFVPVDQARGYHEVISKLETFLSEICK